MVSFEVISIDYFNWIEVDDTKKI